MIDVGKYTIHGSYGCVYEVETVDQPSLFRDISDGKQKSHGPKVGPGKPVINGVM